MGHPTSELVHSPDCGSHGVAIRDGPMNSASKEIRISKLSPTQA